MVHIFQVCAFLREPMQCAHQNFGQADAVGLLLMTGVVDFAQVCLSVQVLTRLVGVTDDASAQIHLLVAALAAPAAN
jgi:hypothetical protein